MSQTEIREAIDYFFDLLQTPSKDEAENLSSLEFALDWLAYARHFAGDEFVTGYLDPPTQDYARFRQLAATKFLQLGFYNFPNQVVEEVQPTTNSIGDALDDFADIACELAEVRWCWDHTCTEDALWHFRFGYEAHWGEHLRNLQWYLEALK